MNCADHRLLCSGDFNDELFFLSFAWEGAASKTAPKAGQFFMIKPKRSESFLGRPLSVAYLGTAENEWGNGTPAVSFLIAKRGKGTRELAGMSACSGEKAELVGPLGNAWTDFLPAAESLGGKPIALIGGGIGLVPVMALEHENKNKGLGYRLALYAGAKTGFQLDATFSFFSFFESRQRDNEGAIASEDGTFGRKGRIPDFLEPEKYAAVCACGPEPMMKAVAEKCAAASIPCFVSIERRMACGVGACLGCTVKTANGNRRCCADGPIFDAREIIFDE